MDKILKFKYHAVHRDATGSLARGLSKPGDVYGYAQIPAGQGQSEGVIHGYETGEHGSQGHGEGHLTL